MFSRSQAIFQSGDKDIQLDCFLPQAAGSRFPAILGLHGSGGGYFSMAEPAGLLAARGFAVYILHYFDRTETVDADKAAIFRNFPVWMKTIWDATSYLVQQPQVDPERIGLLGFSLGAYLGLCNASIDSRIQAVVECFGGLPKEMKFFMRRLCPVLILHGAEDQVVPVSEAYHLQQVLEKRGIAYEMQIYPGIGHGFSRDVWQDAGVRTLGFFNKHLVAQKMER
jgi:carboxymethylenebutenolidase